MCDADGALQPARKKRKTLEDLTRRARRFTIRLASMANRCFWLSAAELVVHILTDGDCLQSHNHMRIFTRQLQWAAQQCKRHLNHEAVEKRADTAHHSLTAVSFQVAQCGGDESMNHDVDSGSDSDVSFDKVEACTKSTNTCDDYAHRGSKLRTMPYYVYRMYVRRVWRSKALYGIESFLFRAALCLGQDVHARSRVALHARTPNQRLPMPNHRAKSKRLCLKPCSHRGLAPIPYSAAPS